MPNKMNLWLGLLIGLLIPLMSAAKTPDEIIWNNTLKEQFFGSRPIIESDEVIEVSAPYRAEDPATVPIRITSKLAPDQSPRIKKISVIIDKNPDPFVAEFEFTPNSGRADLAMRVRINAYSYLRVIAEMEDGTLHMNKAFVKASGGCSAPLGADLEEAMKRLGKMKFRFKEGAVKDQPSLAQLLISHPNITGLQMDFLTRHYKPKHHIKTMIIRYNGEPILTAKTGISISADPNYRFYFVPGKPGVLEATIEDNKGMHFSEQYEVKL